MPITPEPSRPPVLGARSVVVALGDALVASSLTLALSKSWRTIPPPDSPVALEATLASFRPSMAVVDLGLGGESLIGQLPRLVAGFPTTRFIVCTARTEPELLELVRLAGVRAVVGRDIGIEQFVAGLESVLNDKGWPPSAGGSAAMRKRQPPLRPLTHRERQVLVLRQGGASHGQISRRLGIASKTVEDCCRSLRLKFGLPPRVKVDWALLDPE